MTLKISSTLELPLDFVTTTHAILAKKRSGKSYTAQVMAEEMLRARQQVVALDPTGAWWGLRASADGNSAGYPIAVLGGEHGDVPLEATAGEVIARSVVEERFSCVIDTSLFSVAEEHRFVAAFLSTLYRLNRQAMHLFVDEADVFAPQRPWGDEAKTLAAMQNVVRRGGLRGIGVTLITQRPQVLNKDVLSQVDQLTTLRMNHPKDLGAIEVWVAVHGDPDQAKRMIKSLPSLPVGEAWMWAPAQAIFERIAVRTKVTFDSGRTPKVGERLAPPKVLAAIDIAKLGKAIAATVENMRKSDVGALRAEIARLQFELEKARAEGAPKIPAGIDVAIHDAEGRLNEMKLGIDRVTAMLATARGALEGKAVATSIEPRRPVKVELLEQVLVKPPTLIDVERMIAGEDRILRALISYPNGLRRDQLTVMTGYKRSSRDTYLQRLARRGLVEESGGGKMIATAAGMRALPNAKPLPRGKALRDHWMAKLDQGERNVLEQVLSTYPRPIEREEISRRTGYKRSSRDTYLQRLARRELIETTAHGVTAAAALFEVS